MCTFKQGQKCGFVKTGISTRLYPVFIPVLKKFYHAWGKRLPTQLLLTFHNCKTIFIMPTSPYLIPLQSAVNWTTAWRTANPTAIKAFLINMNEVNDMLQEAGTSSIRVYFGLDNGVEKLVLVAVNAQGKDIINPTVNNTPISGTYDFCAPCPPTCDILSPLFTGQML
jgi:hypothetical protein